MIDLFREWDEDGDGTVSKKEFRKAVIHLGLEVPTLTLTLTLTLSLTLTLTLTLISITLTLTQP